MLDEISAASYLSGVNTPIVFIGHSIGGIVIKKVYILARQNKLHETLVKRFHTIFFLATPHRGLDSTGTLKTILRISYSSHIRAKERTRLSEAIRLINDEFLDYSAEISLWSFYETQTYDAKFLRRLIVEPDFATIGCRGENQIPVDANHRSICKFKSPSDHNYIILRNALAFTVKRISKLGM